MGVKYKIEWNYFNSKEKYRSIVHEFNDENHFENFLKYAAKDHSYRKIIGHERYYEDKKEFSTNDLKAMYEYGKENKLSFEGCFKEYFKRELV